MSNSEFLNISHRLAGFADCIAVAKAHVQSWKDSFAGLVPQTVMDHITVEKRTEAFEKRFQRDSYKIYVAEVDLM